jgi:hypothetical protein
MRTLIVTALAAAAFAAPAGAAVVYSNNFDAENGGNTALNYNSFNGLTVSNGTVDLVKSGDFGIICAGGSGSCVDLDGSTNDAGLTSSNVFAFNAGDRVAISFDWSGNQRNVPPNDGFEVRFDFVGTASGTFGSMSTLFGAQNYGPFNNAGALFLGITNIPPGFAMTDMEFFFVASTAGSTTFTFQDFGNDNVGVVIDNLSLDIAAVPEPATWAMMIAGFGAVGVGLRRKARLQTVLA